MAINQQSEMVRTFIAINLTTTSKSRISPFLHDLRKDYSLPFRWVDIENVHITLKFLGDVASDRIERIGDVVKWAVDGFHPFTIEIRGLGVFPDPRRPRIIWIGLQLPQEGINLQRSIERALHSEGFEMERKPFRPHLTIGRIKHFANRNQIEQLAWLLSRHQHISFGEMTAKEVVLFKSELLPGGAQYHRLQSFPLSEGE